MAYDQCNGLAPLLSLSTLHTLHTWLHCSILFPRRKILFVGRPNTVTVLHSRGHKMSNLAHLPSPSVAEAIALDTDSLAPVPIIDLPHRWDKSGQLVPGTSSIECTLCKWNGTPEALFGGHGRLAGMDCTPEPFKCASCELLRLILFKTAEEEGRMVTEKSSVIIPYHDVIVELDGRNAIWQHIFISPDVPKSDIDRYGMTRRFRLSHERLCDASSKWAHERLAECTSSHESCQSQSGDRFLPTRLINLQPGWKDLDLRLEDGHSVPLRSSYIALSYCWGDYRPACITTVENLAQNKAKIPWDRLPLTFQDAAAFTLSLGIRYLWIDSICIIQEDEEDWQRESGKMYAVYKNSYLTLAALFGRDSTHGLRSMSTEQDSVLLAELCIARNKYPVYMRRSHYLSSVSGDDIKRSPFDDTCRRYPLLGRAWAYQERTVSPRVMFFTESEMIFQCLSNAECECGDTQGYYQGDASRLNKTDIFQKSRIRSAEKGPSEDTGPAASVGKHTGALSGPRAKMEHLMSKRARDNTLDESTGRARQAAATWRHKVVPEYSKLAMSMPRDRLPALGAIAEQFQRVRVGETYLAGLWSGSLLDDLLWETGGSPLRSPKFKDGLERPSSLPTWSWASLHCDIIYIDGGVTVPKAEVLEASCSYVGDDAFGLVQNSKLILRGRVLSSLFKWTAADVCICFHDGDAWKEYSDSVEYFQRILRVDMDGDQEVVQNVPSHQEIDFLEISRATGNSSAWHFLLLRRDDQADFVYTRAGKATFFVQQEDYNGQDKGEWPRDGFERIFAGQSVLTTCEIQ